MSSDPAPEPMTDRMPSGDEPDRMPPRRALVLVDVQTEYVDGPLRIRYPDPGSAIGQIVRAIDAAQAAGIPVVCVQHTSPAGAPVFAAGSDRWMLHPTVAERATPEWHRVEKTNASVLAGTGLADWLHERDIDTITLVGFMSNNCDLATAADAEPAGFGVEVLRDATGAIHLANTAGAAHAQQVHETLMVLLQSNWAAVATTDAWTAAVTDRAPLPAGNLLDSAADGAVAADGAADAAAAAAQTGDSPAIAAPDVAAPDVAAPDVAAPDVAAPEVAALAINVEIPEQLQWRDERRGAEFELHTLNVRMLPDGHLAAKAYGRPVAGGRGGYTSFRVPDRAELHELIRAAATRAADRWAGHRGL